jgi:hypothetical protein
MKHLPYLMLLGMFAAGVPSAKAVTVITNGVYYQSRADSPWRDGINAGTIFVDVLEPDARFLNLPGVTSPNTRIGGNFRHGVDEDDGVLDGYGRSNSLVRGEGTMHFVFSPNELGEYPKFFGAVEVEGRLSSSSNAIGVTPIEGEIYVFSTILPSYGSSGTLVPNAYGTFFGIYDSRGLKEIRINSNYLDHVHVGWEIPEPGSLAGCAIAGLGLLRRSRRREKTLLR